MDAIILSSTSDLRAAVAAAVREELRQILPALIREGTESPYLTKRDLMRLTGWSSRQVEYRKVSGQLTYIRHGRQCLFPREAVRQFLDTGRVEATR